MKLLQLLELWHCWVDKTLEKVILINQGNEVNLESISELNPYRQAVTEESNPTTFLQLGLNTEHMQV